MEVTIHKTICDRCGDEYSPQPDYARGKYWIGRHLTHLFGLWRNGQRGEHEVRVYWSWWDGRKGVNEAAIVDLCPECRNGLKEWMINGRSEYDTND